MAKDKTAKGAVQGRGNKAEKEIPRYSTLFTRMINRNIRIVLLVVLVFVFLGMMILTLRLADARMEREVTTYEGKVQLWVSEKADILDMFVSSLEAQGDMYKNRAVTTAYLDYITGQYEDISCTYLADPSIDGQVIMNNGWVAPSDFDLTVREWYSAAIDNDDFHITEPYLDKQTGSYCITFSKRVKVNGKVIGVFGIDLYMDQLTGILEESYSGSGYAFLADETGVIITHPSEKYALGADGGILLSDSVYKKAQEGKTATVFDYDSGLKIVSGVHVSDSRFSVYVVRGWIGAYGMLFASLAFYILLTAICIRVISIGNKRVIEKWFAPLENFAQNLPAVEEGKLDVVFNEEPVSKEIKLLQDSLNGTIRTLNLYINDITRILKCVAEGDLSAKPSVVYKGDFARIQEAILSISENLGNLVRDVESTAGKFKELSEQVTQVTGQVAQGATVQAESVDSLAENMNMLKRNMQETNQMAGDVIALVDENNLKLKDIFETQIAQLSDKMQEISVSSSQIGECLHLINEINEQTNLLALNASIEAARAGEAGKGFAVVAEEIRGLSEDTSKASENINDMIQKNNEAIGQGMRIMETTVDVLHKNFEGFVSARNSVSHMAEVLESQQEYISQVASSVVEIDGIIKTNTAVSEENSAMAEQMNEQAIHLDEQLETFRYR